ncbi:MAG: hypothetical protein A3A94_03475 [Candidatus Portnoybacteria bacterium RIFCSPLOWO2_01_FULL_43_11]|uniref:Uncharacterized protein n=4 Tax=Bacteria candidate phyla TaxID=1783234 RepID=A0A1G2FRX3_9BACT|nr:MAG: hypothetical protein A2713_01810 [candidate division WWE3 bacterium RIFCSPHIGHO2_01_FULL_35_17]OGZ37837.1 MAG: hypothetical protein A3E90_03225 [Candidatus Portnoybacteria bacterium RIFCSPHIGHO2_12_FULL_40_11]OGZ38410.1 MAG: hypothetical protein A3A94_03475 [Candidatus Portnoybacteria bacterium RIFCSPLOWO2_01_FULL_43_11]OGZ40835.1 MAG: hypothetical protein A3I20_02420 [Candidatus Portnoybacteria bacterium RIFCSPLOWO2_02_FULL_40_15]
MVGQILKKIWRGWKKFANLIGRFNTHIILSIFYFLIIGFVFSIKKIISFFSSKPFQDSYWVLREKKKDESNFERQF